MAVIYLLLPLVLILVAIAVVAFLWALRDGQFDDLETPAVRSLFEDPDVQEPSKLVGFVAANNSNEEVES